MPNFGIALGYNNAAGVADFVPYQPLTEGLQYTRRTTTAGDVVDEAPFIRFVWGIMDETERVAWLTQAGLLVAKRVAVTIHAQDENDTWVYLNGDAIKPLRAGRRGYFHYNVPLLVIGIHAVEI